MNNMYINTGVNKGSEKWTEKTLWLTPPYVTGVLYTNDFSNHLAFIFTRYRQKLVVASMTNSAE